MLWDSDTYRARQQRVRDLARERGLAGLIVTDPANLFWLTGYDAWSFYMPQALFLAVDRPEFVFVLREMDRVGAHRTADLSGGVAVGYPESEVHRPDRHPFDWAAAYLRECGWAEAVRDERVGYEGDSHFFSPRSFLALRDGLPGVSLVDGGGVVNWARVRKSEAEIDLLRRAGRIASHAMAVAVDTLRPGVRENEVAAAISRAQIEGFGDADGDYPAIVPLMLVGEAADTPHLTWSANRLANDEVVSIELAGAHHHYHAPLARTVVLGRVDPALERLGAVTAEALDRAIGAVRPGATAHEVASAFLGVVRAAGYDKASRLGYSIGIGYPPDWGEATVSIREGDETVLEPGMAFHLIGGMWIPGNSCEISEAVVVTDQGVEVLTTAPRELIRVA